MSSGVHRLSVAKSGATRGISGNDDPTELARPRLEPIDTSFSFKNKAYLALKSAIVGMDVYGSRHGIRLDERSLAQQFGISRTPVREAMAQLEREGFVRSVPHRGVYVVRKSKREVIELITAWAALESMAARSRCCAACSPPSRMAKYALIWTNILKSISNFTRPSSS